jgi:Amylo-alpha-1,6-glucosidase
VKATVAIEVPVKEQAAVKWSYSGPDGDVVQKAQDGEIKLRAALLAKFITGHTGQVADHLKPDGKMDLKVRPNLFFAIKQLQSDRPIEGDRDLKTMAAHMRWTRNLWEKLVYPWGVATLSQDDPDFHPYHEHWHYYHKDDAYHNGTVWPWLNGEAISAMLRFDQVDLSWQLFEHMNRQALKEGAVGSLAECADALPLPDANWARRTGTFLQAWSNAEHLRIWKDGFLGARAKSAVVSGLSPVLQIDPKLPAYVHDVRETISVGKSQIRGVWHKGGPDAWHFDLVGPPVTLVFQLPDLPLGGLSVQMQANCLVHVRRGSDAVLLTQYDRDGKTLFKSELPRLAVASPPSVHPAEIAHWRAREDLRAKIFANLDFCKPKLNTNLKSLSIRHDPPLTY